MHHNRATSLGPFPDAIHPYFDRAAYLAGAVWLTEVKTAAIRWLWPGRIPLGRLTLLVSDPGVEKSLLTLDIAARISTGAPWPDKEPRVGARSKDLRVPLPTPRSTLPARCFF